MAETKPPKIWPTLLVLVLLVIAILGGGGAYYVYGIQKPMQDQLTEQRELILRLTGLLSPVTNKLDPAYTDANGDLVADPPTDPKLYIDPATIRFCYIASDDPAEYKDAFADLLKALSAATGKPVEYAGYATTEEQLSALKHNRLDITAFSTGHVPAAVCAAGFVPVSCLSTEKTGGKYEMEIIVRADSDLHSVPDLAGHVLGLTEPGSNSGYGAPLFLLKSQFGLLPGRDFSIRYSYGQEPSIKNLASGIFESAAVANDVLTREIAAGVIKPDQFRSIYKSESFPTAAFGYACNLKPDLAAQIRQVLVNCKFSGTSMAGLFSATGENQTIPVDYKNDWALVRRIDDAMGYLYNVK